MADWAVSDGAIPEDVGRWLRNNVLDLYPSMDGVHWILEVRIGDRGQNHKFRRDPDDPPTLLEAIRAVAAGK